MIYLDNAATTKPYKEVLEVFNKVNEEYFANPSSIHFEGAKASRLLSKSKEKLLSILGCKEHDVIFTSGATESINLAIKGYCLRYQNRGKHIITDVIEHPAVLETFEWLKSFGFEVTYLPVDQDGKVDLDELKKAIRKDTILVSIMAINNEVGSVNNIDEISSYLKEFNKIVFHCDVTQAIGKISLNYNNIDMFSFSGHKIHGLKGSGALVKKSNIELMPMNSGGGQENGLRSGTNDLANAVGLVKALDLTFSGFSKNKKSVELLRNSLQKYIISEKELFEQNSPDDGSSYIYNFSLKNKKASVLVEAMSNKQIMISSISACHSKGEPISYVVQAMKHDERLSHNTIRVSFSEDNTLDEINEFINQLKTIVKELKQ